MRIATRFVLAAIIALGMVAAAGAETVMQQCGEEWQAAKANGTTNGETWPQFLKQCRRTVGQYRRRNSRPAKRFRSCRTGPGAPANWLSVPMAAANRAGPYTRASTYNTPTPSGAGQFGSPQEAQYRCPGAAVVWVNEHSQIYHFAGTHDYGHTKRGAYMCEAGAQAAGNRAAKNESHP